MPPLYLHQEFPSLRAFKDALYAWAIEAHFEPRILKSDTCRVRVGCKTDPTCPFIIRCNFDTERKRRDPPVAIITVLRNQHTCENDGLGGAGTHGVDPDADRPRGKFINRSTASRLPFLIENVPRLLQVHEWTKPNEIREAMLKEYGYDLHLQQCRRAKAEILKAMKGAAGTSAEVAEKDNQIDAVQQPMDIDPRLASPHPAETAPLQSPSYPAGPGAAASVSTGAPSISPVTPSQTQAIPSLAHGHISQMPNPTQTPIPHHRPAMAQQHHKPQPGGGPVRLQSPQRTMTTAPTIHSARPRTRPHAAQIQQQPVLAQPRDTPQFTMQAQAPQDMVPAVPPVITAAAPAPEPPVRCPYCVNQRWLRSIKEAVEHMSMHVVL